MTLTSPQGMGPTPWPPSAASFGDSVTTNGRHCRLKTTDFLIEKRIVFLWGCENYLIYSFVELHFKLTFIVGLFAILKN